MTKIFSIGFPKTGTRSLERALKLLGYRVVHGLPGAAPFDAALGERTAADFAALDRRWPGSRFICTLRGDRAAWLASARRHNAYTATRRRWEDRPPNPGLLALYGAAPEALVEDRQFLAAYDVHLARVRAHFAARPGDVLYLDLCARPEWDELCRFLGRPAPSLPFPHENRGVGPWHYLGRRLRLLRRPVKAWVRGLRSTTL